MSDPAFSPIQKQRAFEQILAQLEEQILAGRLRPGDRLPSERVMSEMFGVSRPSLREALRVLDAMGIVEARVGAGGASGTVIATHPGETVDTLMRLHMALSHFPAEDFVQLRQVLEGWAVRRAAEARTDADIAELRTLLHQLEAALDDRDTYFALDAQLHVRVAAIAGNRLGAHLMRAIRDAMTMQMARLSDAWGDTPALLARAHADHTALVEAIAAADSDGAEAALVHHLHTYDELPNR